MSQLNGGQITYFNAITAPMNDIQITTFCRYSIGCTSNAALIVYSKLSTIKFIELSFGRQLPV